MPARGCVPAGSPNVPYDQRVEQAVAAFGSTAGMANRGPPASHPPAPSSPKSPVGPLPSGSTTTGGVSTRPVVVNEQRVAPVAASSAYSFLSNDPTYTTPFASAADAAMAAPACATHTRAPVFASYALNVPSWFPTTTM